jgi:hypothetical protein
MNPTAEQAYDAILKITEFLKSDAPSEHKAQVKAIVEPQITRLIKRFKRLPQHPKRDTLTEWFCDYVNKDDDDDTHEDEPLYHDGEGGYYCERCDLEDGNIFCDHHPEVALTYTKGLQWDCEVCQAPENRCEDCQTFKGDCECNE